MGRYILRRIVQSIVVFIGVTFLAFGAMYLTGDPALLMAGDHWTEAEVEELRVSLGLNRPFLVQYADFVLHAVQGDFGVSYRQYQPVMELVAERLPATALLAGTALLFAIVLAIPLGILSAAHRGSMADQLSSLLTITAQSIPHFWLAIMFILVFGVNLRWVPVSGYGTLANLIGPALVLATGPLARYTRLIRTSMLEILTFDFIRTARAKGASTFRILMRHAFPNSLIPFLTMVGIDLGTLLGGTVVIESIFGWPGLGLLVVNGIAGRDFTLVRGVVTVFALIFTIVNLAIDLLYGVLDPRIRYD